MSNAKVKGCPHVIYFIQRSSCGGIVGLIDAKHDEVLEKLNRKLG